MESKKKKLELPWQISDLSQEIEIALYKVNTNKLWSIILNDQLIVLKKINIRK